MFCCRKKHSEEEMIEAVEDAAAGSCGALKAIGWTTVALGVTALGLFVGREIRIRYKISHRTPMDFFSHAGEDLSAEYGVGV